jgi:hypothetical protein
MSPTTRYAHSADDNIAYQVVGVDAPLVVSNASGQRLCVRSPETYREVGSSDGRRKRVRYQGCSRGPEGLLGYFIVPRFRELKGFDIAH